MSFSRATAKVNQAARSISGKDLDLSRSSWPLDLEGIAQGRRGVEITGDRPCPDTLATPLGDLPQVDSGTGRRRGAEFLGELPVGRRRRIAVVIDLALRDGPDPNVFVLPERATGMDEEDFGHTVGGQPVEKETGGRGGHTTQLHPSDARRGAFWQTSSADPSGGPFRLDPSARTLPLGPFRSDPSARTLPPGPFRPDPLGGLLDGSFRHPAAIGLEPRKGPVTSRVRAGTGCKLWPRGSMLSGSSVVSARVSP